MAYLAGQVASDTSDQTVRGQAQQIFSRIDQLLELAGKYNCYRRILYLLICVFGKERIRVDCYRQMFG